ncbi:hypothetical protein ACFOGI_10760 [Virgibacillus xinjiangensis]|uniref:Uncharacterized protein n=1 Tax=Virgibacillus xinjiangensis TaxID=393090 RepID=A0ABV7CWN0_9BACI
MEHATARVAAAGAQVEHAAARVAGADAQVERAVARATAADGPSKWARGSSECCSAN